MRCRPVFAAVVGIASAATMADSVRQHEGELLTVSNASASIRVETFGARIVSWKKNGKELLWMPKSREGGRWEHGGIPVCWPWHGRRDDAQTPIHGYAWSTRFRTISLREADDLSVLELECEHGELSLCYRIELADGLMVEMLTKNNGVRSVKVTSAIHPYFNIGDIADVTVNGHGFSGAFDKGFDCSHGDVYTIADRRLDRKIAVCADMASRFVVWTPWTRLETSTQCQVAPLDAGEYRKFIAVEPVSESWGKARPLNPGGTHTYRASIRVSKWSLQQ